jgi:hypothetical protein
MSDQVRVNGNQYSWGSIILKLDGDRYTGFTGISFGDKRERVKAYGMGIHQAPRGRSRGKYSTDPVKLTGWTDSIQRLRAALAAKAADQASYGNIEFEIQVQYVETVGSTELPINVSLERCVIVGQSTSNEESADPLKEELEIDTMLIRRNDLTLFDSTEGSP